MTYWSPTPELSVSLDSAQFHSGRVYTPSQRPYHGTSGGSTDFSPCILSFQSSVFACVAKPLPEVPNTPLRVHNWWQGVVETPWGLLTLLCLLNSQSVQGLLGTDTQGARSAARMYHSIIMSFFGNIPGSGLGSCVLGIDGHLYCRIFSIVLKEKDETFLQRPKLLE